MASLMYVLLTNPNCPQDPTNIFQKYGRPNESTPAKWNAEYKDFTAPLEYVGPETTQPKIEPKPEPAEENGTVSTIKPAIASPPENGDTKKRKRHEGETPEERAERKRKKKEKKEKRKSKKDGSDDGSE